MGDPGQSDKTQSLTGSGDKTLADPAAGPVKAGAGTGAGKPTIPEVELEAEIGRGGMGVVYRGRQPYLDRRVAVKLLLTRQAPNPEQFIERFRREAKILASLAHPHIVSCHQAGTTPEGDAYLVMEFIDGPNLREWVDKSGALSEADALDVARDVAKALEYAHQHGVIHRDVKPENVLLQKLDRPADGATFPFVAKLVDLGLARPDGGSGEMKLTAQGVVVGTPATMAPEQFDDPDHVDFRADIYGLGCVLYHMLTGKSAFREPTITQLMMRKATGDAPDPRREGAGVRDATAELVRKMLARKKEDRPQTYADLFARIEALRGSASRAPAAPRRSRAPFVLGILAVIAVLGIASRAAKNKKVREEGAAAPVATAPAPPAARVEFGLATPLLARDFEGRIVDWKQSKPGTFAPEEEGPGTTAQGSGLLWREIGRGPWRVEGKVLPIKAHSVGAFVALDGSKGIGVSIQNFDKVLLVSLVRVDSSAPEAPRTTLVGKPQNIDRPPGDEDIPFALEVQRDAVDVLVAGKLLGSEALDGATPAGVAVFVNKGTARFRDIAVKRPK